MTFPADKTVRTPAELQAAGLVGSGTAKALAAVAERYAVALTPALASLIDRDDPRDPIARQFVPSIAELDRTPEERDDPIGDAAHSPVPGIVHRYPDRVLLTLLHVCPVYCRFCFRRERVGPGVEAVLSPEKTEAALRYIADTPSIWEVILTGGDPLALSPRRIEAVMRRLGAIDHVRVIRFHTRVPVADPALVTTDLVEALQASGKPTYLSLHSNHPRELTVAARQACARIIDAGIVMLSQTVLLKGVNDDAGILGELMRAFVETRIRPYYLHHGDLAPGTSHFRVSLRQGQAIVRALRGSLSGLCQPTYMLDLPGGFGKVPVGPVYWHEPEPGVIKDPWGQAHVYPPVSPQETDGGPVPGD